MEAPVINVPTATGTQIIVTGIILVFIVFFFFGGLYFIKKYFLVLSEEKLAIIKRYATINKLNKHEMELLIDIIKKGDSDE